MKDFDRYEPSEYLLARPSLLEAILHPLRAGKLAEERAAQSRALMLRLCGKVERFVSTKLEEAR